MEMLPGIFLMPTPGHTAGHQSLVFRRADGAVFVAGQSHDTATQYAADRLAPAGARLVAGDGRGSGPAAANRRVP